MISNKKEIKAGDSSTNIQGEKVIVHQHNGLGYTEVKQVALDVFKNNFYELSESANKVAVERAEQLVDRFLSKIEKESPDEMEKIQNPDVQYSVINAQMTYARKGEPLTLELLSELLKKRFQIEEGSLKGIVLNETISVISRLTINQIKLITALFLVKNCQLTNARQLIETLSKFLTDDLLNFLKDKNYFEHLIFAGVAANDVSTLSTHNLEFFIRRNYSDELVEKVGGNTLNVLDPPVRKQFITDQLSESTFDKWNNSTISQYSLTSVGIAVSVAYYNVVMGTNIDLDIWIKG
ncbi:LPO_1073/Vpar_1526 family protein [Niallia circulans]|uniref:LPO_1073/Vpar_1526 family protein n=1 Tax=Niallia circulans TaxID=1397 RepID=UPI001F178F04|nr:LPO_1073/Vpar_1526 family protein [Niallia circulans]MCF2649678.1 hypothetical protein [Niallia circulans]